MADSSPRGQFIVGDDDFAEAYLVANAYVNSLQKPDLESGLAFSLPQSPPALQQQQAGRVVVDSQLIIFRPPSVRSDSKVQICGCICCVIMLAYLGTTIALMTIGFTQGRDGIRNAGIVMTAIIVFLVCGALNKDD